MMGLWVMMAAAEGAAYLSWTGPETVASGNGSSSVLRQSGAFEEKLRAAGLTVFGSGWVWVTEPLAKTSPAADYLAAVWRGVSRGFVSQRYEELSK